MRYSYILLLSNARYATAEITTRYMQSSIQVAMLKVVTYIALKRCLKGGWCTTNSMENTFYDTRGVCMSVLRDIAYTLFILRRQQNN